MAFGKRNVIKLDPLFYSLMVLGESKSGKTTLVNEYCNKVGGPNSALFLEIGSEQGADAIAGINYINTPEFHMEYDEATNSAGIADVCEDIIENKSKDYPELRVVVWDSLDQLCTCCEQEVLRLYNIEARREGKQPAKSLNGSWGGYGNGQKKALELLMHYKKELLKVGVQSIYITHVKRKTLTDIWSETEYETLTASPQQNYFNAVKNDMHFAALLYVDRQIVKEGKGKEATNKVSGEARKIKFRDDSYVFDSGTRFAAISSDPIDYDVDQFIKVMTDAIEAEAKKGGQDIEASKKEQAAALAKRTEEIAEAEKKAKSQKELDKAIDSLKEWIQSNKKDGVDKVKALIEKAKELNLSSPLEASTIEDAKALLAYTESL